MAEQDALPHEWNRVARAGASSILVREQTKGASDWPFLRAVLSSENVVFESCKRVLSSRARLCVFAIQDRVPLVLLVKTRHRANTNKDTP